MFVEQKTKTEYTLRKINTFILYKNISKTTRLITPHSFMTGKLQNSKRRLNMNDHGTLRQLLSSQGILNYIDFNEDNDSESVVERIQLANNQLMH